MMDMICDELKYAESLIENVSVKLFKRDISILSRYFRHLGYTEEQIVNQIFEWCERHVGFNRLMSEEWVYTTIDNSKKFGLRLPKPVAITKNEITKIRELKNYRYEKIIFTLLVLAKYYKITDPSKNPNIQNKKYYYTIKFSSLLRLAHTSQKKDENILHILYKGGYIVDTNKLHNYLITFTDMDDDSEIYLIIGDIENAVSFYKSICIECGKEFEKTNSRRQLCDVCIEKKKEFKLSHCENCGKKITKNSNRQKMCTSCRTIKQREMSKYAMRKLRNDTK
jgi:ribosomal protein S8